MHPTMPSRGPTRVQRWGLTAWSLIGIGAVLAAMVFAGYVLRGVVVPFTVAFVLGILFEPVVAWLARHRVPRWLGAGLVTVGVVALVAGVLAALVIGIARQADDLVAQFQAARQEVADFLEERDIEWRPPTEVPDGLLDGSDLLGNVLSGIGTVASLSFGVLIGLIVLYLTLSDAGLWQFVTRIIPLPIEQSRGIVEDAFDAVRGYFKGMTIIALANAVGTLIGLAVIGVPSALAIAAVTFLTAYIPYLGAFIAGAFAVVVALGAGGLQLAVLALVVVLLVQNVFQSLISPYAFSATLNLHPLVVLFTTVGGGILAGVLGATLATPLYAMVSRSVTRVRAGMAQHGHPPPEERAAPGPG